MSNGVAPPSGPTAGRRTVMSPRGSTNAEIRHLTRVAVLSSVGVTVFTAYTVKKVYE